MKRQFEYMAGDFGFDMVTYGWFIDSGYMVNVYVVRMKGRAVNDYILSDVSLGDQENTAWVSAQTRRRAEWEKKVLDLLSFRRTAGTSAIITEVVSEIFTIVTMEQIGRTAET